MRVTTGFGSALAIRPGDPAGVFWAACDRGPNLKAKSLNERYGVDLQGAVAKGGKIMPRLDLGPSIAEFRIEGDAVLPARTIRLTGFDGAPISGVPMARSEHASAEPAFDLDGRPIEPEPGGADTEGLVALRDGGFWIGDEYGPSLMRFDPDGRLVERWLPLGCEAQGTQILPQLAAKRQINRGFEALTASADERWLFLAFQSPLAHPDEQAHEQGRHVRIWRLDAKTGAVHAQYLYPLDPPESFVRDGCKGAFGRSDIKVSELLWAGDETLLVLERGSETTKIHKVQLEPACALPADHLDVATRPTVEELGSGTEPFPLATLAKTLLFSSDDAQEVAADLEGMALLSQTDLLLVSDNDFGVEGAQTSFWLLSFSEPIA